ncbi:MAG: PTS sugar transporter subunit IIA [Fuerstiella sp.]|nr:PTS sugar transporter subunit IIA [Fuerstiella sp.]
MSYDSMNIEELMTQLGRERRVVERMASRGHIPGRRVAGEWRFNRMEITQWLETEIPSLDDQALARMEQTQQSAELDPRSPISQLIHPETVQVPLDAGTKPSTLQSLVEVAGRTWQILEPTAVLEAVKQREAVMSTGFENGVAIPHPRNPLPDALSDSVVAFGRTSSGIPFGAPGRALSDMFFLVLARDSQTHLQILARIGRLMQLPEFVPNLRAADTSIAAHTLICEADTIIDG